jgi:hypothetical protein
VIVRMWHGRVSVENASKYRDFLIERAIPDYRSVPGNLDVQILERVDGAFVHFITTTHWDTLLHRVH